MAQTIKSNAILTPILLIAGLILIPAGFIMLTREPDRTEVTWLNMAVVYAIYFVNTANLFGFKASSQNFNAAIPKLGIHWLAVIGYTILAIGGIFFPWQAGPLEFNYRLYYQLVCFFILAVFYVAGNTASKQAIRVKDGEKQLLSLLMMLRHYAAELELALQNRKDSSGPELLLATQIKDNIRYLSPSSTAEAYIIEKQILAELEGLKETAAIAQLDKQAFVNRLTNCNNLIKKRKQLFFN